MPIASISDAARAENDFPLKCFFETLPLCGAPGIAASGRIDRSFEEPAHAACVAHHRLKISAASAPLITSLRSLGIV